MKVCLSIFLLCGIFCSIDAYKILTILPMYAKSHYYIGNAIAKSLLDAGHEVTVVSPYPSKEKNPNRRDIYIKEIEDAGKAEAQLNMFDFGDAPALMVIYHVYDMIAKTIEVLFQSPKFKEVLNSNEKYDLVLYESFVSDVLAGLGQHFDCPVIGYTTFAAPAWANQITGNPSAHAYVPNPFLSYTAKMSYYQRLIQTLFGTAEELITAFKYFPKQRELYSKFYPNSKSTFDKDFKKVSLVFINNHFSGSSPRHLLPNMIEIAGVHVQKPKPLPKEWQTYLDNAKDGVVYFSMGSVVQSKDWDPKSREALLRAFSKLKQKVLWKYENETLPNQPKNVKIGKWLPQRDILAHPNVKLFITHGGLLGTTEALVSGVPVIGIPVFGDQKLNIARAKDAGYGLSLYYREITEEKVTETLNEMLNNPIYYETAQRISKQFNDRPLTPQQSVAYWTEYVIRHNGAAHLRSPGNELSFIEYHLIDVYATLLVIFVLILFIIRIFVKKILNLFKTSPKAKLN